MEAEEEDFEEEEEGRESAAVRAAEAMAAKWELDVGLLEGPEGDWMSIEQQQEKENRGDRIGRF